MTDIQNKIDNVDSLFKNLISNYKTNYVNHHKNTTLSMPTSTESVTLGGGFNSNSNIKDENEKPLLEYRYAANNLLEHVRSQVDSNSSAISKINSDIVPLQKRHLRELVLGDSFYNTKTAAGATLDDYNELYKTTFFSILMYLVGSASILYIMFKPKLQSV
jgi:hypothetical protein